VKISRLRFQPEKFAGGESAYEAQHKPHVVFPRQALVFFALHSLGSKRPRNAIQRDVDVRILESRVVPLSKPVIRRHEQRAVALKPIQVPLDWGVAVRRDSAKYERSSKKRYRKCKIVNGR
jgi:hypothetical protein